MLTRSQSASLDRWLTTPPDDVPPQTVRMAADGLTTVCTCSAYKFPHRVGGGDCYTCPDCENDEDFCTC